MEADGMIHGLNTVNTTRIPGQRPYDLGVNITRSVWPHLDVKWRPSMAILTPVDDCPTPVAAASLVHFPHNGPLFLTERGRLHRRWLKS